MCDATIKEIYFLSPRSALRDWLVIFTQPNVPHGVVVRKMRRENIICVLWDHQGKSGCKSDKVNAIGQKI